VNDEAKSKAHVLEDVCSSLAFGALGDASQILRERYPFVPFQNAGRSWTPLQALDVYLRDGFTDRYSGLPLVFPGTLRIISLRLPSDFPFHPNWKASQCHIAYWELLPTIDHVIPVSRGGADNETNWVTTSMVKNAAKANFKLEEIDWQLLPERTNADWDGLTSWFSKEVVRDPDLLSDAYIRRWAGALRTITSRQKIATEKLPGE
jgi:5-methylcytosine-specific restriction endonuclease McrA